MRRWQIVVSGFLVMVAATVHTFKLNCARNNKCTLTNVKTNENFEIKLPTMSGEKPGERILNLEISQSNFIHFPGNIFDVMPNLVNITARSCRIMALNEFGPSSTHNCEEVRSLRLEGNHVEILDGYTFSRTKRLTELILARNRLSNIDVLAFYALSRLEILDLSYNQLAYLDTEVFAPLQSLRTVHLRANQFQAINLDVFHNNEKLSYVNMVDNELATLQATQVDRVARHIDLRGNDLVDISALAMMKGMYILQLSDNKNVELKSVDFAGMEHLIQLRLDGVNLERRLNNNFDFLTSLRHLRVLFIGRNELTSLSALPHLPMLYSLIANNNQFRSLDVKALKMQAPNLREININKNPWECRVLSIVTAQLRNARIKLSFYSDEGVGSPETGANGRHVEGVSCDNDNDF